MDDQYVGQHNGLVQLGAVAHHQGRQPSVDILETFENRDTESLYITQFSTAEFSSLCPKTGQPDFAFFDLRYVPNKKCIESKSLKLYLFSYRNEGQFMESITNQMLRHFVEACDPLGMEVKMHFNARGGIRTNVTARHFADGCKIDEVKALLLGV